MLMAVTDDRAHLREALDRSQDPLAELGMLLHDPALLGRQRPGLEQDARRDPNLPDVVEQRTELELLQGLGVEPEARADLQRRVRDPPRVRRGVLVVRFERVREGLDRRDERRLEALEAAGVGDRELRLMRETREQAGLVLVQLVRRPGGNRDDDATEPAGVQFHGRDGEGFVVKLGNRGGCVVEDEGVISLAERFDGVGRKAEREDLIPLCPLEAPDRCRRQLLRLGVLEPDCCSGGAQDGRRKLDDPAQHLGQPLGRRQLATEFEQLLEVLGLPSLGLVQPGVLERDRGVAAKHLE